MFCPSCGKDNLPDCKYCASCGINLEPVSRALYTSSVGFFTRFDTALNQLVARYSERVFKNAPTTALSRKLSDSWKTLGQGLVTLPVDFVLFWIMLFVVLPFRLLTLVIS
ncbi:MAG TPA: zinc ribbon domain-containing protein, partial [Blastocatellia bacterium]|nr:zinc ribbon domain-containing protein [Blastocatellia bacterium]